MTNLRGFLEWRSFRKILQQKIVIFRDINGSAQEFIGTLEGAFPALRNCGGFKIMRCCRSRQLIDIAMPPGGYTARFLKDHSTLNKAIGYIVPIQVDLNATPELPQAQVIF